MSPKFTKYPAHILCSDGVTRDGWQILHENGTVILKVANGRDPHDYGPPKERKPWHEIKADHSFDEQVRLSFQRDRYGKDGLDRQPK